MTCDIRAGGGRPAPGEAVVTRLRALSTSAASTVLVHGEDREGGHRGAEWRHRMVNGVWVEGTGSPQFPHTYRFLEYSPVSVFGSTTRERETPGRRRSP